MEEAGSSNLPQPIFRRNARSEATSLRREIVTGRFEPWKSQPAQAEGRAGPSSFGSNLPQPIFERHIVRSEEWREPLRNRERQSREQSDKSVARKWLKKCQRPRPERRRRSGACMASVGRCGPGPTLLPVRSQAPMQLAVTAAPSRELERARSWCVVGLVRGRLTVARPEGTKPSPHRTVGSPLFAGLSEARFGRYERTSRLILAVVPSFAARSLVSHLHRSHLKERPLPFSSIVRWRCSLSIRSTLRRRHPGTRSERRRLFLWPPPRPSRGPRRSA